MLNMYTASTESKSFMKTQCFKADSWSGFIFIHIFMIERKGIKHAFSYPTYIVLASF